MAKQEKHKYTEEELAQLHREVEEELKKIPGVMGVGFGAKEKDGKLTNDIAFRVYVKEKKDKANLSPEEIIPTEIKGFKTDVIVIQDLEFQKCNDDDHYGTLIGGISITNLKLDSQSRISKGTLGCLGTLDGNTSRDNVVFLTNNHVACANGGTTGDKLYQPQFRIESGQPTLRDDERYPIGEIVNVGLLGDHNYRYPEALRSIPSEPAANYFIDCAAVKVSTCYSTCCNTNMGVSFSSKNEINNLRYNDTDGNNFIKGIQRVRRVDILDDSTTPPTLKDYFVWKVGRTTGRTKGKVIGVEDPVFVNGISGSKTILIQAVASDPDCAAQLRFTDLGDSGSVIVNMNGEVIGLHALGNPANIVQSNACHIHPVLDRLKITLLYDRPPAVAANRLIETEHNNLPQQDGKAHVEALKEKIHSSEAGKELYQVFEKCRAEVVWLVNRKRPVTLAWHRNNGPAFVAHFVNNTSNPELKIPTEVKGITLQTLLVTMKEILKEHGSGMLKKAIARYEDQVLELAMECSSLDEFFSRITSKKEVGI